MNNYIYPPSLLCDFYKVGHIHQYPEKTERVYSNFTARGSRMKDVDKVVSFGLQAFIKKYLIKYFDENFFARPKQDVIDEYVRVLKYTLDIENPDYTHIAKLHDLGYLPLKIKAVKEGTLVPLRVPMLTIENTHPDFFWVTNFIETLMSAELWQASTSATISYQFRQLLDRYAMETVGDTDFVPFQGHDFSFRGLSSLESAKLSGAGHLLNFVGTDTIPAILFHEEFYNADIEKELIGSSVPATEHSVACSYGRDGEFEYYKRIINEVYPSGIVSIVSDTYNLWDVLTDFLPRLKEDIMSRDGKIVVRPDSGNPADILCGHNFYDLTNDKWVNSEDGIKDSALEIIIERVGGETPHGIHGVDYAEEIFKYGDKYYKVGVSFEWNRYDKQYYFIDYTKVSKFEEITPAPEQLGVIELLWNTFGGTVNEKGYKELDSHIGAIYGDSITLERAKEICERLKEKGFASINVVFGLGSYTYQYNTRDTFGFAMKATHVVINGEERNIIKDPVTDSGEKKSATGRLVVLDTEEYGITMLDSLTISRQLEFADADMLEDVFIDGKLVRDESLAEIRQRIREGDVSK